VVNIPVIRGESENNEAEILLVSFALTELVHARCLLPEVCSATSAKGIIFRHMCLYELLYETCLEVAEQNDISYIFMQ
jgi:hypothetical protein